MFDVKKECCNECLFSKDAIVSDARRKQILQDCKDNDTHFVCHKATINNESKCCRAFYDTQTSNLMRISQRIDAVKFVD